MKEQKIMFLVVFTVMDGEAEYFLYKVVFASTENDATGKALKCAKDFFGDDTVRDEEDADSFWSEDGARAIELREVVKATVDDLVKMLLIE